MINRLSGPNNRVNSIYRRSIWHFWVWRARKSAAHLSAHFPHFLIGSIGNWWSNNQNIKMQKKNKKKKQAGILKWLQDIINHMSTPRERPNSSSRKSNTVFHPLIDWETVLFCLFPSSLQGMINQPSIPHKCLVSLVYFVAHSRAFFAILSMTCLSSFCQKKKKNWILKEWEK